MGDNPSHFKNKPRHPVESVKWDRVQEFVKALNAKLGNTGLYRLPTEQEWEYICRGGPLSSPEQSKYHFYFARSKTDLTPVPTDDLSSRQANFHGNHPIGAASKGPYLQTTSEVGSYLPNPFGIFDLHGNVWEWTSSQEGSDRVIRGGGWLDRGVICGAASRSWLGSASHHHYLGFRLLAVPVRVVGNWARFADRLPALYRRGRQARLPRPGRPPVRPRRRRRPAVLGDVDLPGPGP